jgi:hypothetical protein
VDTRTKIISPSEASRIASEGATVVSGVFDPMIVEHAERLKELKRPGKPLLVLISPSPNEILPALARAHLIAGLESVDYVSVAAPDGPKADIGIEKEDAVRLQKLIEHVHARQRA